MAHTIQGNAGAVVILPVTLFSAGARVGPPPTPPPGPGAVTTSATNWFSPLGLFTQMAGFMAVILPEIRERYPHLVTPRTRSGL
jgi:hypothetical protein